MSPATETTPRRVLITADTIGGVWTYAVELSRGLIDRGVEVILATMGREVSPDQRAQVRDWANFELRESRYALEWMDEPWRDVDAAGEWLLELERDHQPDVIHSNSFAHGALAWNAPVVVVGHSCVLSWWQAVKGTAAPATWSHYAERVRRGIRAAAVVIAPSRAMLASLESHYGPLPTAGVIANGGTAAEFQPGRKEPFILSVGRLWDEAKNVRALTAIAADLPWPVRLAGEAGGLEGTRGEYRNVELLGQRSRREVAELYARASLYALPAKYEPFGLSVLEAALSGCALVLGDIESLRENWSGSAVFVPPDDHDAWRHALRSLVHDESRRQALSRQALNRAQLFGAHTMIDRYVSLYRSLTVHAPTPAVP